MDWIFLYHSKQREKRQKVTLLTLAKSIDNSPIDQSVSKGGGIQKKTNNAYHKNAMRMNMLVSPPTTPLQNTKT